MAAGLAGFAQGLSSGMNQGIQMGLAVDKNKRDQEMFDLQKEKLKAENEELQRKNNFRKQVADGLAAVEERINGGVVGGEAEDEFGESVGKVEYATPKEAKASGLKFKQGTTVEKAPEKLTQTQIDRMRAEVFQKARIDNQLMDEDSFEKQRQINKTLKKEGFQEAYDYFYQTGDSNGAIDIYKKNGKHNNVPEGTFMKLDIDPDTGFETIVVYAPGPDGKPQKLTSSFDFHLSNMPEEMIKYGMGLKKEKFVQGQENKRLGYSEAGKDRRTAMEVGAKGNKDKEPGWIIDLQKTTIANIKDDPTKRLRAGEYEMAINEAGALARKLAAEKNLDANTAWAIATQEAYSRRGLVAPTVKTPKQ